MMGFIAVLVFNMLLLMADPLTAANKKWLPKQMPKTNTEANQAGNDAAGL
jgi:hypothetical protein